MKQFVKIYLLLVTTFFNYITAQSDNQSSSFILTTNNEKIAIEPGYPIYHNRNCTKVYCKTPKEEEKVKKSPHLSGNLSSLKTPRTTVYLTNKTQEVKKIVDGERVYIPIVLKKKKKNSKIIFARIIAKKGQLTLLTFSYHSTRASELSSPNNSQFIITKNDTEIVEIGEVMNNYLVEERFRNLVKDKNAKLIHKHFGECLNRNPTELFDVIDKEKYIGDRYTIGTNPVLLWNNNNINCQ